MGVFQVLEVGITVETEPMVQTPATLEVDGDYDTGERQEIAL